MASVYARNEDTKKSWVQAVPSSHIWTAHLPRLAPGTYPVVVEARDEYGRVVATRLAL